MFASPGDVAFSVGSVSVYYYGIIMAASICVGILTARFVTKKYYPTINPDVIYNISPHIIIFAILGARIYYCLLSFDYYAQNPSEILQLWHGGISIHGAIIGGLIGGIIYAKKHKLPVLKLCDIFSYGLILGQALGRWGNFFNSEAFGLPTNNFIKLFIPISKRPLDYMQYSYFHPTFLYESILDVCIFLILFFVVRRLVQNPPNVILNLFQDRKSERQCDAETSSARRTSGDGIVFFSYLILYSIARILIEQIRIDSVLNVYGVPIAQIVSVLIILISAICLIKIAKNKL
ncbi:MAG: prolipoprotein diacylglyceryl transferase [Candidatus Gastranaerophilaceae bacterium]